MAKLRPKVFTWHIHGTYLYYLSQAAIDIYIPVKDHREEGYYGRGETFPFGDNVIEVPVSKVKDCLFDCIIFQTQQNYLRDQYEILTAEQRHLPRIHVEHDPPTKHPTGTPHPVNDPAVLLVHVTHYNQLMWDNGQLSSKVIEHGVIDPGISYSGEIERGIVVINNLPKRGRLLGLDIFLEVRKHIPLDLVGMGTGNLGLGEVLHPQLPEYTSRYRFFFNPIRYTSLGLAVCEAMMIGIPVVGLATTELPTVITHKTNGFVHTDVKELIGNMKQLLHDESLAKRIGAAGKQTAVARFNIDRFIGEWEETIKELISSKTSYEDTF